MREELYITYISKDTFITGTTTSDATDKLIDSGALFVSGSTPIGIGDFVFNTSTELTANVTAVDSETQLTLSVDIFPSGSSPIGYKINKKITESVELLESLRPNITFNIADISNPEKRKSDYSKTIKLAGSKINKIFEWIFEVNIDLRTFNPNLKTEVLYLVDGETSLDGYLQLKQIDIIDNNDIIYECTIIGRVGNFINELSNKELTDLDMSGLNHTYNKTLQVATWNYPLSTDYVYPMINYDINYSNFTTGQSESWTVEDFYPAITVKKYIDEIFLAAGYSYDSTFFETTYFENLIIPFSSKNFALTAAAINDRIFKADTPLFIGTGTDTKTFNGSGDSVLYNPIYLAANSYRFATRNTNEIYDVGGVHNTTTGVYTVNEDGFYNLEAAYDFQLTMTTPATVHNPIYNQTEVYGWLQINKYDSGGNFISILDEVEIGIAYDSTTALTPSTVYASGASPTYPSDWFRNPGLTAGAFGNYSADPSGSRSFSPVNRYYAACSNVFLSSGEQIKVEITAALYITLGNFADSAAPTVSSNFIDGGTFALEILEGYFKNSVVNSGFVEGNTIDMNGAIPLKIKQKDFFTSILNMFNLYVQADTSNEKNLYIEPRDDFYDSTIVDWSQKLDVSKELEYLPMGALDSKEYLFTYKQDKDYYNTLYNTTWDEIYGERRKTLENEFLKNTHTTKIIFSPTPNVGQAWYDRVIPTIIKFDDQNGVQRTQSNIRILQWAGMKDTQVLWTHDDQSGSTSKNTYPFAGMYNDPFQPTEDIAFGLTNEIYWSAVFNNTIIWTNNNLYNKYYNKFIDEITDTNSKIVKGWFYLSPSDINSLTFKSQYYFNNAYFRLNKIENYNPDDPITKCEFLKLKDVDAFVATTTTATGGVLEAIGEEFAPKYGEATATLKNSNSLGNRNQNIKGNNNYISRSATNIDIKGDSNKVYGDAYNITVQGNNNIIHSGVQNVLLINTNDLTVSEDNTTYIDNTRKGSVETITASDTTDEAIETYLCDTSAGGISLQLNTAPSTIGKTWNIKVIEASNTVTVRATPNTIDGAATKSMTTLYETKTVMWDGVNYQIISEF